MKIKPRPHHRISTWWKYTGPLSPTSNFPLKAAPRPLSTPESPYSPPSFYNYHNLIMPSGSVLVTG